MELRHLRFFLVLADELHFTRAAARLRVAQPHLSQEIRRMERELGVLLFRRTRRRVELTAAGDAFRAGAATVWTALDEAVESARCAARGEIGRLVVGFVGSAAYSPFPEAVRRFRAECPGVRLLLEELSTVQQLEALRRGTIDVGLMRATSLEEPGLVLEVIRREPFVVALPVGHPCARRRGLRLADLAEEQWIAFEQTAGPGLHAQLVTACETAGFSPRIAQTAPHVPTIMSLVAGGLGVALVPEQVRALRPAGVRLARLTEPAPSTAVVAGWRRVDVSTARQHFVGLLGELTAASAS
jgi:DNA-binding transcriptional LysR family regulator